MNIAQTVRDLAQSPRELYTLKEMINDVAEDYNFGKVSTLSQVIYFCEECEIGEELLQC